VKKVIFAIAGLAALGGMGYLGARISAQEGGVKPAAGTTENKPTTKIGYMNITKVIKEFKKANALGDIILKDAQKYENELKTEQEAIKAEEAKLMTRPDPEKEAGRKDLRERANRLQDKDLAYQKDIRRRRDEMAVEINKDMQRIVDSLAKHMGFDLILSCPDVATTQEVGTLSDAMRRMTAQAVWVAWKHPGLDISDECIKWLNYYCPAPGAAAAPAGSGNK
jgi:Skp family chaperone for outer membrane proteins